VTHTKTHSSTCKIENLDTAKSLLEGTTLKDIDLVVDLFAEDAKFLQPYSIQGAGVVHEGVAKIRDEFESIFKEVEKIAYETQKQTVSTDGLAVFIEVQGDMKLVGSSKNYRNYYVFRFDFDESGNVQCLTEYMNSHYLAQFIGS